MSPRHRANLAWLIVGCGALVIFARLASPLWDEAHLDGLPPAGTVLAVENVGAAADKEAVVQLPSGAKVRASIPPGCLVFAGQTARLRPTVGWQVSAARYVVLSTEDRK